MAKHELAQRLSFDNGITLELLFVGEEFRGIGEVTCGDTLLRSDKLPWTIYAESNVGYRFESFRLERVESDGKLATLTLLGHGAWSPRAEEADSMCDARTLTRRVVAPTATVRWSFRAITEQIWEAAWSGLATQVEIDIPGAPIHWILEEATWEIDGEASGCTLIQQDVTSIDLEQFVERDSVFTTRERFIQNESKVDGVAPGGLPSGIYPMDMMPRGGGVCPLDFQVKGDTALIHFAEKPGLTRACHEKSADEDVIHYLDRPFFPMTESACAPERKFLVYRHPKPLKRHAWRNLWLDAFTEVRSRVQASYGYKHEVPRPIVWAFMWNFDLDVYGDQWVEPLIDALPTYRELGYTDLFTHGVFEGTSNDPDLPGGNVCLNYDYRYCDEYGGTAAMKRLFDAAHDLGMKTWQWFGLYLAPKAPDWKDHPEWKQLQADGTEYGGAGRMRSGFRDYLWERLTAIRRETGLDGVFWDSYQNTGLTNLDWRSDDKAPHTEEIWRFQADLQMEGLSQRCEVVSTIGITNVGIYGFDEDATAWDIRRRWWSHTVANDDVFVWLDCSVAFFSHDTYTADKCSPEVYFWLLGHRSVPTLDAFPWGPETPDGKHVPSGGPRLPGGELAGEYGKVNHMYNAALPRMHRLRVTEGGHYTLWLDEQNQPAVIWAFRDSEAEYNGTVRDLTDDSSCDATGTLTVSAGHVYLLNGKSSG